MRLNSKKTDYKWIILIACFLMTFFSLGFCSSNKGLFLSAITDALHIKRSMFSVSDSLRYVSSALINLFFGTLLHRFGVRKMVGFGFLSLFCAMMLYATADNIWLFYLGGIMLGVGLTFTTGSMTSAIIRRWFKKDIGKYTGIVYAANGVGGALAAQIVSPMINEAGNAFGYRNAYRAVSIILLVAGILIVAALRERPKEEAAETGAVSTSKKRGVSWTGIEFGKAIKSPIFYVAGFVVFLTGFMLQGLNTVYAAHLKDVGLDVGFVATVASVFSLALTCTKILVGALYDRFGLRVVMIVCQLFGVVAFVSLLLINATATGMALAILFVLAYALSLPLETLVIPLIVNDLFGNISFDKVMGMYLAMNYTGYALGAPIINLCYDHFGSYDLAFALYSILMLVSCIVFQFVIRHANDQRRKITAQALTGEGNTEKL